MSDPIEIISPVKLVLITGNPGSGKTAVAKMLGCGLPEPWEVVHLDHFLFLQSTHSENLWDSVEASAVIRATPIKYYCDRGGRVVYEGIIQTDREVDTYCRAAGVKQGSSELRFFDLRCSREEAVRRMRARPLKEGDSFPFGRQYDDLTSRLRAMGATRISTDGKGPEMVLAEIVRLINRAG